MDAENFRVAYGKMERMAMSFADRARNLLANGYENTARAMINFANLTIEDYEKSEFGSPENTKGIRKYVGRAEAEVEEALDDIWAMTGAGR